MGKYQTSNICFYNQQCALHPLNDTFCNMLKKRYVSHSWAEADSILVEGNGKEQQHLNPQSIHFRVCKPPCFSMG